MSGEKVYNLSLKIQYLDMRIKYNFLQTKWYKVIKELLHVLKMANLFRNLIWRDQNIIEDILFKRIKMLQGGVEKLMFQWIWQMSKWKI